jgi:hypothetical protein
MWSARRTVANAPISSLLGEETAELSSRPKARIIPKLQTLRKVQTG